MSNLSGNGFRAKRRVRHVYIHTVRATQLQYKVVLNAVCAVVNSLPLLYLLTCVRTRRRRRHRHRFFFCVFARFRC